MAIAVGARAALGAAPPQGRGLCPFSRCLHDPFRRELAQGTQSLLPTTRLGVALPEGRQGLCLGLTWRYPLRHTGGSFFLVVKHLTHADLPREGPLVPPPLLQAL
jgi:hypothetical protein